MKITPSETVPEANLVDMSSIAFLPTATIAIIGLGLIGGSVALALRGHCARLLGIDVNPEVVRQALKTGLVDDAGTDPAALIPYADLLLIAVPVLSSLELIHSLPRLHPGHAVVMDMGSTKREVMRAMALLPDRFDPIGGHPMCGKESGSLVNAEVTLFQKAAFALVPLPRSTVQSRQVALELVAVLGSHPLWLEADQHDRWVAATSHLPHLLATALVLSTPLESASLAGSGFRSTSRLAAGSAHMKTDIFATNRQAVLDALAHCRSQLDTLAEALEQNDLESLYRLLASGAERRQALLGENNGVDG